MNTKTATAKVKFLGEFTDKNGNKYEPGKVYDIEIPYSFLPTTEEFNPYDEHDEWVYDPDCMDEQSEYLDGYMTETFGRDMYLAWTDLDMAYSEDEASEYFTDDDPDSYENLVKNGSVFTFHDDRENTEVDHSKNETVTKGKQYCILNNVELNERLLTLRDENEDDDFFD